MKLLKKISENKFFSGMIFVWLICFAIACVCTKCNSNVFTVVSAIIGAVSSIYIGYATINLTKKINDISQHRDKEKEKELKEQYANQLKLTANPIIYFDSIDRFNISSNLIVVTDKELVNRLTDIKFSGENHVSNGRISMELNFSSPKPESVENIYIKDVRLIIKKEDPMDEAGSVLFINNSTNNSAKLKYKNNGVLECHMDLLVTEEETFDELITMIDECYESKNMVVLLVNLTASNSLNVSKDYECGFYFTLESKLDLKYDTTNFKLKIEDYVMWFDSVKIN